MALGPSDAQRNPAILVAPGTSARLELARGVAADVVRGARPGPIVWLWAARGQEDPSLQQALGEVRDALRHDALAGAVGFLLDGPTPPIGREANPHVALVAALARDASAIVLLAGPSAGLRTVPHAAVDLLQPRDRRLAVELGLSLIAPSSLQPALNRNILAAPTAWLIAGEADRLDRATVELTTKALTALLVGLGLITGERSEVRRATVRSFVPVELTSPGLVAPAVEPGALVAKNQLVASVGEPGSTQRRALHAPTAGVALYVRSGWLLDGVAVVLARPPAPVVERRLSPTSATEQLGWCELVDLPELGVARLPAKIDSGARTSVLHVAARRFVGRERGKDIWEIEVPTGESKRAVRARVEVIEQVLVRDSGGHAERRPVIETSLRIGERLRRIRVTLTDRGDMRFPMLVGRTALDARTRIDPTRSYLTRPVTPRPKRRGKR